MKHINHKLFTFVAMSVLGLSFLTAGCERTVSQTEESKVKSDGTVKSKEQTVTEAPDGSLKKTETKTTSEPNGVTKTESKVVSTNRP